MVQRVFGYIEIPSENPEKAVEFYNKVFGWGNAAHMGADYSYMFSGNLSVGFPKTDDDKRHSGQVIVYVDTPDLEADLAKNAELGGSTLIGKTPVDDQSWFAWFTDLAGNTLGLFEQTPDYDHTASREKQSGRPFVHVEIPVKNRHADAQYYGNLFGWQIQQMDDMNYGFFMTPDEAFGGGFPEIGEDYQPGDVIVYLHSDDLEADSQAIEAAGGKLLGPVAEVPAYGQLRFWSDPTGNRLALWNSNPRASE